MGVRQIGFQGCLPDPDVWPFFGAFSTFAKQSTTPTFPSRSQTSLWQPNTEELPQAPSRTLPPKFLYPPITYDCENHFLRIHSWDSAVKQRGRERKGPPRNHPEISSQKLADFECGFPMTPMEGTEHHLALFRRRILGQYPASPRSPGPFRLLLKDGRCTLKICGNERRVVWRIALKQSTFCSN